MKLSLVVLAAGMGSRYGGLKQIDPVGPSGEAILDYSVFDAMRAGFSKAVFVIRKEMEEDFRTKVAAKYAGFIETECVFQDSADLPAPFAPPPTRSRPWGTAHAIRAARRAVAGSPFAAINADDFYGRDSFRRIADFLATHSPSEFAMAGFRLSNTLSGNGSVARGVCSVSPSGRLLSMREHMKLVPAPDGGAVDEDPSAGRPSFPPSTLVSMNLWGFTPVLLDSMEKQFPRWLAENASSEKAEWQIPSVVDLAVRSGAATVEVLPTSSRWFGITYREDKPGVVQSVRALVEAGEYPERLFERN